MPVLLRPSPKADWDALVENYAIASFIDNDPISIPHRYRNHTDWRTIECTALLSALLCHGGRSMIIKTLNDLFDRLDNDPLHTILSTPADKLKKKMSGFYYRFNTASDMVFVLNRLSEIYQEEGSLKALWAKLYEKTGNTKESISEFRNVFLKNGKLSPPNTYGMKFLFADPMAGSAAKRFNMFLRWMVRHDAVDFGLWQDAMPASALMIPLDTHVAKMARLHGITKRKTNDWKCAEEITAYFRKIDRHDPVKYDFALFGLGVSKAF